MDTVMAGVKFFFVTTMVTLSACGAIKKDHGNKDEDQAPKHALVPFFDFSVAADGQAILQSSLTENRVLGLLGVNLSNTTVGPVLTLPTDNGCAVTSGAALTLKNVSVKYGSVCAEGLMNLRGVDANLPVQKSIDVNLEELALQTQRFENSLKEAITTPNVVAVKRNQTLTLEVHEAAALYVVRLTNSDLENVYKIERSGPSGPMVIWISDQNIDLYKVTMQDWFDPRQTLWYFDSSTTVRATQSLLRGNIFAPRATFRLKSTRIDGALRVFHVVGDVKLTWHPMQIAIAY